MECYVKGTINCYEKYKISRPTLWKIKKKIKDGKKINLKGKVIRKLIS